MKFQHKYLEAKVGDEYEFEYSYVVKTAKLGRCGRCGSFTSWKFAAIDRHVCSEECAGYLWGTWRNDPEFRDNLDKFEKFKQEVQNELVIAADARSPTKDIIVVVHNQLKYLKICVDSIRESTQNFCLYIWDNASSREVQEYYDELLKTDDGSIKIHRCGKNEGFIYPNNECAKLGKGEFIICLNSDTKVFPNWDRVMTGFLDVNPEVAQVGFWGGHMDAEGRGFGGDNGYEIDYIPGWCFCIKRETYNQFGLFNENLKFAYCEDADLSLRLKSSGRKIYALHAPLVYHYQNRTIEEVHEKGEIDVESTFRENHEYLKDRWKCYIENERVLLKRGNYYAK